MMLSAAENTLAPGSMGIDLLSVELRNYLMSEDGLQHTGGSKRGEAASTADIHQLCGL